jgi:hypothetical protein
VRKDVRRGLALVVVGGLGTAAGWVMIIPGYSGYSPLAPGLTNRINLVAALGLAALAAGVALMVAASVRAGLRERAPSLDAVATLLLVPVALGYFIRFHDDVPAYDRAGRDNRAVLARMRELVPTPAPGTNIFTFGEAGFTRPSLPIFAGGFGQDQVWAARVEYGTFDVGAFPVLESMSFACESKTMALNQTEPPSATPYGHALLVDLPSGRVIVPHNRADCIRATNALKPYAPEVDVNAS